MQQGGIGKYLGSESDGNSTDDAKRKREEVSPPTVFKRSRKTVRTPLKRASSRDMDEERKELTEMMKRNEEMMNAIMQEVKEIRRENREYREDVVELKRKNEEMEAEIKYLRDKVEKLELVEEKVERLDKAGRKNNILITGIEIKEKQTENIKEELKQFMKHNLQVETEITEVYKLDTKTWIARIGSFEKKLEILRNKRRLKNGDYKRVYINNDLTEHERNIQRKIRNRADKERDDGKTVRMGFKRMIIDGEKWVWNGKTQDLVRESEEVTKNGEK